MKKYTSEKNFSSETVRPRVWDDFNGGCGLLTKAVLHMATCTISNHIYLACIKYKMYSLIFGIIMKKLLHNQCSHIFVVCPYLKGATDVTCGIGIVSQAGNWKYLDFEDPKHSKPESAKINKTHRHWNTFKSGGGALL